MLKDDFLVDATMSRRYDEVIIFCPDLDTGGPEALHQFCYCLQLSGINAGMVYTGPVSNYEIIKSELRHSPSGSSPVCAAYHKVYGRHIIENTTITTRTLLVFPEVMLDKACEIASQMPDKPSVAIWWLSVDNIWSDLLKLSDKLNLLFSSPIMHFCQSYYAYSYVLSRGAKQVYLLFDYTRESFVQYGASTRRLPIGPERLRRRISCFPKKGGSLSTRFFQTADFIAADFEVVPIKDMTPTEVVNTLLSSSVYIDFGHFPGKDRVPREARCLGNVVLILREGAASFFADFPIPEEYKFNKSSIDTGELVILLKEIVENYEFHLDRQEEFLARINAEKTEFNLQIRQIFSHE